MIERRKMTGSEIETLAQNTELKRAMKEAINEWLDCQFIKFGKWTFWGFAAAATAAVGYMILVSNGWHR